MTIRMKVDGVTGKVAVYDYTAGDDLPFTAPLSHVGRLHFHSDLPAIKIVSVQTGSKTLAALNSASNYNPGNPSTWWPELAETLTLFAHGVSGTPYIEGRITSIAGASVSIPLVGHVPVQNLTNFAGLPRWLSLAADATNVFLNGFVVGSIAVDYPAIEIGYEVYVTDLVV